MKLYTMYFRVTDKEYSPEKKFALKKVKHGADLKAYLNADGGFMVMETEVAKYWDYGGGIEKIVYTGDISDDLFKPTLTDHDFVDEQIKSKKNGETVGYQG
jgi:hypothetical protein